MNIQEIVEKIFYSPATNGKAKGSISEGVRIITELVENERRRAFFHASENLQYITLELVQKNKALWESMKDIWDNEEDEKWGQEAVRAWRENEWNEYNKQNPL